MFLTRLGHLHPALVHLPIGVLFAAALAEVLAGRTGEPRAAALRRALYALAAASALCAAATGWWLAREGYEGVVLLRHRWSGVALAATLAALALADLAGAAPRLRRWLLATALALVVFTGHQGGTLTHGRGFLLGPSESPPAPEVAQEDPAPGVEQAVREVFARHCLECHGPDKQKSGLRFDHALDVLEVVQPGLPGDSELFRRIVLPRDSEDAMPPADKGIPLTDEELLAVLRWIQAGAPTTQFE